MFLGPTDYIGTSGGGIEIDLPVGSHNRFSGYFEIPKTYPGGGRSSGKTLKTKPGSHYLFGVYPAGICGVKFTVK